MILKRNLISYFTSILILILVVHFELDFKSVHIHRQDTVCSRCKQF